MQFWWVFSIHSDMNTVQDAVFLKENVIQKSREILWHCKEVQWFLMEFVWFCLFQNQLLTFHIYFFSVLTSEVYDLRIVLQSADKELSAVKQEYRAFREKQEKEMSQLSDRHMDVQFKLDSVRYVGSLVKCLNLPPECIFCLQTCALHFLDTQKATLSVLFFFFPQFFSDAGQNMMRLAGR